MRLADLEQRLEQNTLAGEFLKMGLLIMSSPGVGELERRAKSLRVSERIQRGLENRIQKAVVGGATTGSAGLSSYGAMVGAFTSSLSNSGAFDRMLRDAMTVPMRPNRVVVNTVVTVGSEVAEGAAKPLRAVDLAANDLEPTKIVAQVVMSQELVDGLTDAGMRMLGRELRAAVTLGSDGVLLTELSSANTFEGSATNSWAEPLDQLEELMRSVKLGAGSRPYFITTSSIAKALAKGAASVGLSGLGPMGGEIFDTPLVVSDAQSSGRITFVDASSMAVATEEISLRSSEQATVEMSDAPAHNSTTPTATSLVSLWQTNSRCLLAERSIALKLVRENAAATLTGANWGSVGDSPVGF
jgi:hypothetical protein